MFDINTKFRYFQGVLKEVYTIIDLNYNIQDDDIPKLLEIISKHLDNYNSKNGIIRMGSHYNKEEGILDIYLSDYIYGRGMRKLFQDQISIKSLMRDKLIDDILNDIDSNNINNYKYER